MFFSQRWFNIKGRGSRSVLDNMRHLKDEVPTFFSDLVV